MVVIRNIVFFLISITLCACQDPVAELAEKRILVLGVDGMDYAMTARLMAQGRMPNFSRLSTQGGFQSLATSVPPLSPVAWSDFMTGMDSGGHGIFDFLHRDPEHIVPEFSMSRAEPPSRHLNIGSWSLPLDSGRVLNLREGNVFWQTLREQGVRSTIIRMPANYPPVGIADRELSGMGTPDLRGTYGVFTFITTKSGTDMRPVEGGEIQEVWPKDGVIRAVLKGPPNPLKEASAAGPLELPIEIIPDNAQDTVLLRLDDQEIELAGGEWSPWIPIEFKLLPFWPFSSGILHGMVRCYLRAVAPELELYVSPINFDPINADTTLSHPAGGHAGRSLSAKPTQLPFLLPWSS